ncbi:ABC transporter ATP-binding protein [Synechococcus elongatus]|uniref:ABC transporter ATP-binding protein n=1 Tax=Synechococcus elongatus PCC 11802 TaxID=2283154 RepID=A0AAT9K080_SYNEL|nr:ABC transporter ATP-binding protein [Synechococcus elongatus]QFZ93077.1 ABC transporter ATP-binding protein [Synechococcus elongatus PCC 11802]
MTALPLLELDQVFAGYLPDLDIVQGVNLQVAAGELLTLLGPNGAGKSTLAKTLLGLVPVRSGSIRFRGQEISRLSPEAIVRLGIGYVPQVRNVFASLTVAENLEMGLFQQRPQQRQAAIARIYDLFPTLADRRSQRAGTLSGGERQLLAMGRALAAEPLLLVLDEPSAALSPLMVTTVFDQIRAINRSGTTIILVEQNTQRALRLADRGCILESGRDRQTGPAAELLNDPLLGELYLGRSQNH